MPQPDEIEVLSARLRAVYATAWHRIERAETALLEEWPSLRRAERMVRLRELQTLVDALAGTVDEQAVRFSSEQLPRAFLLGAVVTATEAAGGTLAGINLDAIAHLAGDTYADLLAATKGVQTTTKQLIRTLAREHVGDLLIQGDTAVEAARKLRGVLEDRGITAVTYANGARHGLADYADMLVRTKSAIAYNAGGFAALTAGGVEYVEVFDGSRCGWTSHDDPNRANGTIRTLAAAQAQPISHPRCRRSFGGRPDITSAEQAAHAQPTSTPAQRVDQARVEQLRELDFARRRAARAIAGQVDRRAARLMTADAGRITSPSYARRVAARQVRADRAARQAARTRRTASRGTKNTG